MSNSSSNPKGLAKLSCNFVLMSGANMAKLLTPDYLSHYLVVRKGSLVGKGFKVVQYIFMVFTKELLKKEEK